tara:strand:+ start:530 stop:913 length:384 start_codon:yes stop_codon:yes gene_type:complete
MTLYTSGEYIDSEIALLSHHFVTNKYPLLRKYDVEVHYCDLSEDNVKGWQEKNGDEFLIHIDTNTVPDYQEHVKTLLHELIHCCQDIRGVTNNEERENEAYMLEEEYFNEFDLQELQKSLYSLRGNL